MMNYPECKECKCCTCIRGACKYKQCRVCADVRSIIQGMYNQTIVCAKHHTGMPVLKPARQVRTTRR